MVISDSDITISWGFFMAKKSRSIRDVLKSAVPKTVSCANCRTPDWKSADGKWCHKRRIDLDPAKPIIGCKYWRAPKPL
jgi:hypothetical protein